MFWRDLCLLGRCFPVEAGLLSAVLPHLTHNGEHRTAILTAAEEHINNLHHLEFAVISPNGYSCFAHDGGEMYSDFVSI